MVLKSTDLTPISSLSPFSLLPYNVDDEYSKNRIVRGLQRGELNCIFCVFLFLNSHHIFRSSMEKMRNLILTHPAQLQHQIFMIVNHTEKLNRYINNRNYIENHNRQCIFYVFFPPVNTVLSTQSVCVFKVSYGCKHFILYL